MAKSMRLWGGWRFAKGKAAIMAEWMSAESAWAIMASQGRKKYWKVRMAKMAAAWKKRASKKKTKKTSLYV